MTYYIIIKYIVLLSRCYIQNDPSSTQLWHLIGFVLCYIRPLPGEKSSKRIFGTLYMIDFALGRGLPISQHIQTGKENNIHKSREQHKGMCFQP